MRGIRAWNGGCSLRIRMLTVRTKRRASAVVLGHVALTWFAVAFRVDAFPLTWAPMYSVLAFEDVIVVRAWNDEDLSRGLVGRRRNGARELVTRRDLNLPRLAFWRLYYERAFGRDPNKLLHANAPFERRIFGPPGNANWEWRVLRSVNQTLGRAEADDTFLVELRVRAQTHRFARTTLRHRSKPEVAILRWNDAWSMNREPR